MFITLDDGRKVYLALRKHSEIYRAGRPSLSDAMREGVAGWAIDAETLLEVGLRGIDFVGVFVKDTGDKYVAHRESFFDPYVATMIDYSSKGGSIQRVLPLAAFTRKLGLAKF